MSKDRVQQMIDYIKDVIRTLDAIKEELEMMDKPNYPQCDSCNKPATCCNQHGFN